jgi:chromosome partitioning protein
MMVFSFVTQKGGSGKSTLAINCAVAALAGKQRVLIVDLDEQATATDWFESREAEEPLLVRIKMSELETALEGARSKKFDIVLIDTPGRDAPATAAAIKASDFCVVPCRPSYADMKATPVTIETIRRLNKPAAFVLTQTPVRSFRNRDAQNGLSVLGMVAPVLIASRNAYQDAQGAGLGVIEFEPEGKAAQEIKELWAWIIKKAKKVKKDGK